MSKRLLALLLVGILILAGCGQAATPAPEEQADTAQPEATSPPPTEPPTATAEPTSEPTAMTEEQTAAEDENVMAEGKELVIGMAELPANLDPQKSLAPPITIPYTAFADPLMRMNYETNELEPALAVSWERIDDTTLEVKLREGVTFQNGEPLNADAVKYSFERALNPDLALSVISRVRNITDVEVVDDYTVRFTTDAPDPILDQRLTVVNIVPPDYIEEVGEEEFAISPIGTGAFRLVEHIPQQEMIFEAWPDSWRRAPALQRLIIRPIPDDAARLSALRAGDIDLAYGVPPDQIGATQDAGFEIVSAVKGYVFAVRITYVDCDCPFEDVRVRQALQYAIDKQAIAEQLFGGFTEPAPGQHLLPFAFGYNPDVEMYPYDPDKARDLLTEAGYPDGFDTVFQTTDGRGLLDKEVSEAVVGYLNDAGIRAKMEIIDSAQYVESFHNAELRSPLQLGWWLYIPLDAEFVLTWFQCSEPRKFHCDPAFDEVYNASRQELDPAKREELLQEAVQLMHDNPPDGFLIASPDIYGLRPEVTGFSTRPDGLIWFDDLDLMQ